MIAPSTLQCVCIAGYVNVEFDASRPPVCMLCVSGSYCVQEGLTVLTLPLRVGYFRVSPTSLDVQRCPDASTNCTVNDDGTFGLCFEGTSACRGTSLISEPSMRPL